MKNQFAKLFDLEGHQVLITKDDSEEDEGFHFTQTTHFEDCVPSMKASFEDEVKRDEAFDNYNIENAKQFVVSMLSMLS